MQSRGETARLVVLDRVSLPEPDWFVGGVIDTTLLFLTTTKTRLERQSFFSVNCESSTNGIVFPLPRTKRKEAVLVSVLVEVIDVVHGNEGTGLNFSMPCSRGCNHHGDATTAREKSADR